MKPKKIYVPIFYLIIFVVVFMSGLWAIDVSVSGMIAEAALGIPFEATGFGDWTRSLNSQYHLGLIICLISVLSICARLLWLEVYR